MRQIIERVTTSASLLRKTAWDLVEGIAPYAGTEPDLVARVCEAVLHAAESEINRPVGSSALSAEIMTDIALTLHRQDAYRETGLRLFEQMLVMNFREARAALDLLDRRPTQTSPRPIRRRRRRR